MKLLYATSIYLPSVRANRLQILSMAKAFQHVLGNDFVLGVASKEGIEKDIRVVEMGMRVKSYMMAWRYIRYAHHAGVTHIYCREEKLLFFLFLYNRLLLGNISFFYEIHHLMYLHVWWFRSVLQRMLGIVSITHAMKSVLEEAKYPPERIIVAADAVAVAQFDIAVGKDDARRRLQLPMEKQIIVYTGSIHEPWKGVGVLHEAAKQFGNEYLFIIVGGKPHYVENFRATYPDISNFKLLGHKSHSEVPLFLKAADILVLPNSATAEVSRLSTSPMKMFEYMVSGTPIVGSGLLSIREVLNENNALLVPPDDPNALAEGIREVFEQTEQARQRAHRARRDVERYSWDKRAESILSFLKQHG